MLLSRGFVASSMQAATIINCLAESEQVIERSHVFIWRGDQPVVTVEPNTDPNFITIMVEDGIRAGWKWQTR